MRTLRKGHEPNGFELLVNKIDIKPKAEMRGGVIEASIYVKLFMYDLDDLLCQMIDDYGEDELIKRINEL